MPVFPNMKTLSCLIAGALLLASCSAPRYMYSPSVTNTAMSSGTGDGGLDAYASNSGNNIGLNLAGTYAISRHLGIGAQFYTTKDESSGNDVYLIGGIQPQVNINYNRQLALAHAYFYAPLEKTQTLYAEIAAGYGTGTYKLTDVQQTPSGTSTQTYTHSSKANHTVGHLALYGVLGDQRNIRVGASLRFNSVRYHDISTTYTPTQLANYELDSLSYHAINFLEPSLTFRYIFTEIPLQITAQVGLSSRLNEPRIDYRSQNFSLGVGYNFMRKRAGKK